MSLARFPLPLQLGLHCAGDCDLAGDLCLPFRLKGFLLLEETSFVTSLVQTAWIRQGGGYCDPWHRKIRGRGIRGC